MSALRPCKSCPWRVDNDASIIPGYNQEKAEALLACVGNEDSFRPIMACHHSAEGKETACRGYLAQEGYRNLNVRLMIMAGRCPDPISVADACYEDGTQLEEDYHDVLAKLSAT